MSKYQFINESDFAEISESFMKRVDDAEKVNQDIMDAASAIPMGQSNTSGYTGNPGDTLTHKHNPNITIELVDTTARGWKVQQIENGKSKVAFYDKQDIVGERSLFESDEPVNQGFSTSSEQPPTVVGL